MGCDSHVWILPTRLDLNNLHRQGGLYKMTTHKTEILSKELLLGNEKTLFIKGIQFIC